MIYCKKALIKKGIAMTPNQKKKRLIALATVLIAFVVLALLNTIEFQTPEITTNAPYAPDTLSPESFYPTPEGDLSNESGYLVKDLTPSYSRNGLTEDLATANDYPYTDFFKAYFKALADGDGDALNALYSEVYFRNHPRIPAFSRQYLYDVTVNYFDEAEITVADSAEDEKYIGRTLAYFEVTYRIYQNDGSFRRDIVDDIAITQIFTLLLDKSGANPKLNSISYWNSNKEPADVGALLPVILPLVWLGIALVALIVSLILKKKGFFSLPLAAFVAFLVSTAATLVWQLTAFAVCLAAAIFLLRRLAKRTKSEATETTEEPSQRSVL